MAFFYPQKVHIIYRRKNVRESIPYTLKYWQETKFGGLVVCVVFFVVNIPLYHSCYFFRLENLLWREMNKKVVGNTNI